MSRFGGRASALGARRDDEVDHDEVIDMHIVVEKLHNLSLDTNMSKIKQENKYARIQLHDDGPPIKVYIKDLIRSLPHYILSCLISHRAAAPPFATLATVPQLSSTDCHQHIAKAFSLLVDLSEVCINTHSSKDDKFFPPNEEFTAELIDAAIFALLTIAGPRSTFIINAAEEESSFHKALIDASMLSFSLRALVFILSRHHQRSSSLSKNFRSNVLVDWEAVCDVLLDHPRGAAFIRSSFEATATIVRAVRAALVSPSIHSRDNIYNLAFHAGSAMELVFQLCACPLMYHRMMLDDGDMLSPLRLIESCLNIHDNPLAVPPFKRRKIAHPSTLARGKAAETSKGSRKGSGDPTQVVEPSSPPYSTDKGRGVAELLAARGFTLILILGEQEGPSYFDTVAVRHSATNPGIFDAICTRTRAYVGQVLLRPAIEKYPVAQGEGQMAINVLRAAEYLSDDSNFKKDLISGLAPTLVQLLSQPNHENFRSAWCLGEQCIRLMSNPSILINSCTHDALEGVKDISNVSKQYYQTAAAAAADQKGIEGLSSKEMTLGRHLSLEMNVLLSKLLVNLHYHDEKTEALKGAFLSKLSTTVRSLADIEKKVPQPMMACMARNLESLFSVAWQFGGPDAVLGKELMNEMDMKFSKDLLDGVKGLR